MTDSARQQAAEAREKLTSVRSWTSVEFDGQPYVHESHIEAFGEELAELTETCSTLADTVDALSARLSQTEEAIRLDDELEMECNALRAKLREYKKRET